VRLVYKFLVPSFSYEFLVQETWTVCHQHKTELHDLYWWKVALELQELDSSAPLSHGSMMLLYGLGELPC